MTHLPLWYLSQITPEECDQIVSDLSLIEPHAATMGIHGDVSNLNNRNTTVRFAQPDYWLTNRMCLFANEANRVCKWDYHITEGANIQFAEYKPNQHYGWHTDTFPLAGTPCDRKITVVALLNDQFTGGEFKIRLGVDYTPELKKGSMIAFPSIIEHCVVPVLTGVRYSATIWLSGPRFR